MTGSCCAVRKGYRGDKRRTYRHLCEEAAEDTCDIMGSVVLFLPIEVFSVLQDYVIEGNTERNGGHTPVAGSQKRLGDLACACLSR